MALSPAEITGLTNLETREGGWAEVTEQYKAAKVTSKQIAAIATLMPAVTVTVRDWSVLRAFVNQVASDDFVPEVMAEIQNAAQAGDDSKLGPLFVALYAGQRYRMRR